MVGGLRCSPQTQTPLVPGLVVARGSPQSHGRVREGHRFPLSLLRYAVSVLQPKERESHGKPGSSRKRCLCGHVPLHALQQGD
jgi:hypothetical protein